MRTPKIVAKEIIEAFDWPDEVGIRHLEMHILKALKEAVADTWRRAATEVGNCMKHYPGNRGDPSGCLEGLACEFSANADGNGPNNTGDSDGSA